jgi:hypothetical protein
MAASRFVDAPSSSATITRHRFKGRYQCLVWHKRVRAGGSNLGVVPLRTVMRLAPCPQTATNPGTVHEFRVCRGPGFRWNAWLGQPTWWPRLTVGRCARPWSGWPKSVPGRYAGCDSLLAFVVLCGPRHSTTYADGGIIPILLWQSYERPVSRASCTFGGRGCRHSYKLRGRRGFGRVVRSGRRGQTAGW